MLQKYMKPSREDLTAVKDELSRQIPEPLYSMLPHKESKDEAIHKYKSRQQKETSICPPTCSGIRK